MKKIVERANNLSNLVQEMEGATNRARDHLLDASSPATFDQNYEAFVGFSEREHQARRDHREAVKAALREAGVEAGLKAQDVDFILECVRGERL